MWRIIKPLLVTASGNALAQRMLERNVLRSHALMGIGSGAEPRSSGERALVKELALRAASEQPLQIFDVGANTGQFLHLMRRGLREIRYEIHVFEPTREAFAILSRAIGASNDVRLNNVALGNVEGVRELFYDMPGSALASFYRRRMQYSGVELNDSEQVRVDTIDNYCEGTGVQQIDLLKLDVEGHELEVLHGAAEMLAAERVAMVSFEFGGCNIDSRTYFRDFYDFLQERGMCQLFRITPSGYLRRIDSYHECHEQFRTTNFLARRD